MGELKNAKVGLNSELSGNGGSTKGLHRAKK